MPYVSSGNRKMTCPTFNLPACVTCPDKTEMCAKHCYARKAEKMYPDVLPCRKRNLADSEGPSFVRAMVDLVQRRARGGLFRIHESGDFYSQAYLDKWIAIAKACPGVRFLAFTKSFHLDFSKTPRNLQLIASVWPDTRARRPRNWPRAYAGDCKRMRRRTLECTGLCDSCGICWYMTENRGIVDAVHFDVH